MRTVAFGMFVVLALACGACAAYRVDPVRIGAVYPSKGERCGLRFENVNFQEGSSKFEHIGMITVSGSGSDEFTGAMKADVERAACHMGGDAVSLNAGMRGAFQFLVWKAR
jgi:hypothetical protein